MRRTKIVVGAAGLAGLLITVQAWADVPPPEAEPCKDKQVGDVCDLVSPTGQKGVCVETTCTKVTPPPLPDSGPLTYTCVLCEPAADGGVQPLADLGAKHVDSGACPGENTCQAAAPDLGPKPTADASPRTTDAGVVRPASNDSGCAVGGMSVSRVLGPWFLAAAVSGVLLLLGRRRRR